VGVTIIVLVLTKLEDESIADVAEKLLYQLQKTLAHISYDRICMLINEDNIHYKYCKFLGKLVFYRQELVDYIDEKMTETSEDSE
jgi:hypothetical protein